MTTTLLVTLTHVECYKCHVVFGLTAGHLADLRSTHDGFYCPSGHLQYFTGLSEAERLRREKDQAVKSGEYWQKRMKEEQESRLRTERRLIAQRGATTRLKRRAAAGTCPCCHRTFQGLARHMKHQHPEFVASVAIPAPEPTP